MFDIIKAVQAMKQLEHDKMQGLPKRRKSCNPPIKHIDGSIYEKQAVQEGIAISRSYKSRTIDFGRRLRKALGQIHHPGGETSSRL